MTQKQEILSYLKTGQSLTPMDALKIFGTFRLASRIFDLKKEGWPIICDPLDIGDGRKVGHYFLVNDKDKWPEKPWP